MKITTIAFLFMIVFQSITISQTEKDIASKITKVTVYTKGAQIESESKFELQQGKFSLSFKNLSPYIKKESIRIDGDGSFSIQNVQLSNDYLNELEKNKEMTDLNKNIQTYLDKIEDEETWIKITNEKLDFLKSNKNIVGNQQSINPEAFKSMNLFYAENFEKHSMEILKRQRAIKEYNNELSKLKNQINSINSMNKLPSGVITVLIESKQTQKLTINLSYMVDNASWYPSYDIRYINSNKPLAISYKANISQNTGVEWKNVELKLSTAKTNISAQIPTLSANYLQFYNPIQSTLQGQVSGLDISSNSAAPGTSSNIMLRGSRSVNGYDEPLYVVDGNIQNDIAAINPEDIESIEVLKDAASTAIYGSRGANGVILITTKKAGNKSKVPFSFSANNETSMEYSIEGQQTINSDNKLNIITFKETELSSTYEYQAIPKLSKNVYLIGKISDWNKADLANGAANLYYENSFIGNSKISTQQFTDTLDISFGIDNNILVDREKIKDFSESKLIGTNKKETFAWKLSIRNNKTYSIKAFLYDQIPISSTKDIDVETLELSGGILNIETGMVKWTLDLKANETKQIVLKYSVKYPKDKIVIVD